MPALAARAQDPDAQPVPRAVPLRELLPDFQGEGESEVVSESMQFKIRGGDAATRAAAAILAEETKRDLLRLSEKKEGWKVPVSIGLRGRKGDPVVLRDTVLRIIFNDERYEIGILVNLNGGFRSDSYKRAVVEALVFAEGLEDMERRAGDVPLVVPPWVTEGILEAAAWAENRTDRKLYDSLFRNDELFKLVDLFAVDAGEHGGLDGASRAAFRVSAGALMMALIEQPDGREGLREFLKELPAFQGEMPGLLRTHFPELNRSGTSLEKWWKLQLANKGSARLTDAMSPAETERELEAVLKFRVNDPDEGMKQVALAEWEVISGLEKAARLEAVRPLEEDLVRLSYRCFPSYRGLLLEYQQLFSDLVDGETKEMGKRLEEVGETRRVMREKVERARDFLNYFQITRARETSGAFDDYLDLKARLKARPGTRKDPITEYLDRLEPFFKPPEKTSREAGGDDIPQF